MPATRRITPRVAPTPMPTFAAVFRSGVDVDDGNEEEPGEGVGVDDDSPGEGVGVDVYTAPTAFINSSIPGRGSRKPSFGGSLVGKIVSWVYTF